MPGPAGQDVWKSFNTKVDCLFADCYKLPEPLQIRACDTIEKKLDVFKVKITKLRECIMPAIDVKEDSSEFAECSAANVLVQAEEAPQAPKDVVLTPSNTEATPRTRSRRTPLVPKGKNTPQMVKSPNPVQAAKSPSLTEDASPPRRNLRQEATSSSRPRRSTPKKLPDDFISGVKRKVSRSSIVLDDAVRSTKKQKKSVGGTNEVTDNPSGDVLQAQTSTEVAVKVEPEVAVEVDEESPSKRKSRRIGRRNAAGGEEAQSIVDVVPKIPPEMKDDTRPVKSDVEGDVSEEEKLLDNSLKCNETIETDDDQLSFEVTENPPDDDDDDDDDVDDEPMSKQPDLLQMKYVIPPNQNSTLQAQAEQEKAERKKAQESDEMDKEDPTDGQEKAPEQSPGKKQSARSPEKRKKTPTITTYQCPKCPRGFEYDYLLTAHIALHIPGPCTIRCDICQKDFKSRGGYVTHMRMHSGIDVCKCPECDYVAGSASQVRAHIRQKHERNAKYLCDVCGQGFVTADRMKRHREALHNKPKEEDFIQCELCSFKTANRYGLKAHMRNMHSNEQTNYVCTICGAVLKFKQSLLDHQKRHYSQKNFQCSLCSFLGICEKDVKNHIRRMHLDTSYKCDVCGKVFKQSGHLARHAVIHTGAQDYQCKKCSYKCNVKGNLSKHMAQVHKTTIRIRNVIEKVDNAGDDSEPDVAYLVPKQEEEETIAVEEAITAAETLNSTITETSIFEVPIEVNNGQVEYQQVMYMQSAPDEVLEGQVVYTVAPDESVYT